MEKIHTFVELGRLTPPSQVLSLAPDHFTQEEQDLIEDFTRNGGMVLLNTSAGWWRFLITSASNRVYEFKSSGEPGVE